MEKDLKILAKRLRLLREEKGLTQKDLAKDLALFMGKSKKISPSAVCSWENGEKNPTHETLLAFTDYYGVSADYLLGKTSNRLPGNELKIIDLDNYIIKISASELNNYDGKPVYLVFNNEGLSNRWGIYNKEDDRFCCRDNIIVNNSSIEYYAVPPKTASTSSSIIKKISLDEAKKQEQVWIDYKHPDTDMCVRFSGWYRPDTKSSVFVAPNGFVLPFDSIDVVYHVYKKKPDIF